jgi:hypothetical protein
MEKYRIPVSLTNQLHMIFIAELSDSEQRLKKRLWAVISDNKTAVGFTVYVASDDSYWYFEKFELAQEFYAET